MGCRRTAQPLIDSAADALAAGLDTPTLRMLAGVPRSAAEDEVEELTPHVFTELGLPVSLRRSHAAIVDGAKLEARRFLDRGGDPRIFTERMARYATASDYTELLRDWMWFDDEYDLFDSGYVPEERHEIDKAVREAAEALQNGHRLARERFATFQDGQPRPNAPPPL